MVILATVFIIYFLLLAFLLVGWNRAMKIKILPGRSREQLISVIVPVRNEEFTIANLLSDLSAQEYRKFEVIVVNDHSDDGTLGALSKVQLANLLVVNNKGTGKKAAISTGVKTAKGSIIVTTDADCSLPKEWLTCIHQQFRDRHVMMAFGGVRFQGDGSFFASLQEMEFASLIGSGAATATMGFPTMCNAANLAFRKKAFLQVKGYQDNLEIPSGDDEFLMRKIAKHFPGSVHFINDALAVASTRAEPSIERFFHQRLRWTSKWRFNTSLFPRLLAVFIVLIQICALVNLVLLFSPMQLQALFLFIVKVILEAAFLLQVCRFMANKWNWVTFFALQLLYPLYVISIATASFFVSFQWKNRIFKP